MQLPVVLILLLIGAPTAVTFGSLIQAMQQSAELEGVETFLTAGYRVVAEYSDTACTILRYGQTLRLNSCIRHDDRMWVKLISNSTTVLSSLYTDSTCTQKWVTLPSTYTSTCTADSNLHLFSLSGIPPSSTPIVRCSYSAADAGVFFYAALDTCISDLHKIISINGTVVTVSTFITNDCSDIASVETSTFGEFSAGKFVVHNVIWDSATSISSHSPDTLTITVSSEPLFSP